MFEGLADEVIVLSLPDAAERRARLPDHLAKHGIRNFRFHDAFGPDAPEVRRLLGTGQVRRYPPCFRCGELRCDDEGCNNVLIPEQVANFASHIEIWKSVAAKPQVALILEDDVHFFPWGRWSLTKLRCEIAQNRLELNPDVPRLIRLGWPTTRKLPFRPVRSLQSRAKMANPCHLMTSAFARAALDRLSGIDTTSDIYLHVRAPRPGEALTLFPPVATELSFGRATLDSAIHPKPVFLDRLRKTGDKALLESHEARLRAHICHIYHRPIIVTGHPRSGTTFVAELAGQVGLDIGHERGGEDGISSWMFAVDAEENPWAQGPEARTRRAVHWTHMIQTVRDPATAVPSIIRENRHAPASYDFRREHILRLTGEDLDTFPAEIDKAVASLCLWNRIIRQQDPHHVVRIEDGHAALIDFLTAEGFAVEIPADLDLAPKNAEKLYKGKHYEKPAVSQADWDALLPGARALLAEYCAEYGYPDPLG